MSDPFFLILSPMSMFLEILREFQAFQGMSRHVKACQGMSRLAFLEAFGESIRLDLIRFNEEKVNVSETCVPLTIEFDGRLNTRRLVVSPETQELIDCVKPSFQARNDLLNFMNSLMN